MRLWFGFVSGAYPIQKVKIHGSGLVSRSVFLPLLIVRITAQQAVSRAHPYGRDALARRMADVKSEISRILDVKCRAFLRRLFGVRVERPFGPV